MEQVNIHNRIEPAATACRFSHEMPADTVDAMPSELEPATAARVVAVEILDSERQN